MEAVEIETGSPPRAAVIWLHGLGADGHDFEPIVPELRVNVPVRFVFSDRVRVYLNGRMLYAGNDGFVTHDPDFLGIVGLFDELALPLKRGPNELWFAVSETFGGWAITADLPDRDGITVSQ